MRNGAPWPHAGPVHSRARSLGTPTITGATPVTGGGYWDTKYQISWTPVPNATYYNLWITDSPPYYLQSSGSAPYGYIPIGKGGSAWLESQACNASGCGGYSNAIYLSIPFH